MTPGQIKIAAKLYGDGMPTSSIAESCECSPEVVRYYLRKHGVVLRVPGHVKGHRHNRAPSETTEEMKRMRREGKTFSEIGEPYGLTAKVVQSRLHYHGIQ
jgi:hypothetical protein